MTNDFITALQNRINSSIPKTKFIGVVKTAPPNITIEYLNVIIPTAQIKVLNYLLPNYHRTYKLDGIIDEMNQNVSEYTFNNTTNTENADSHTHPIKTLKGSGTIKSTGDYKHHGDLWFTDTLRVGCEVLVEIIDNSYVVVGQVVQMPSNAKEGA